ncbi:aldo/keto reductase [Candidatus Acetothermia bacterium]|nr:aldo/keto reductase [Candidatus Acetothermia bacterium]
MQYRTFGRLDWKPSALGFGAMRLPTIDGNSAKIDEKLATQMVRRAIDCGVNYIDTAWVYHQEKSEPLLGRALQDGYRKKVKLATKMPSWLIKASSDFDKYLDEQLKRLQTDQIDFYLLHALNKTYWSNLRDLGVLDWAEKAIADHRIGALGFSFHDQFSVFKEIIDAYDWIFCMIMYNCIDVEFQAGRKGLHYAATNDVAVVIMEPLRGGLLAQPPPQTVTALWESAPITRSPTDWALQWLWDQPEVSLVLSGMSTMEHVEENIESANRSRIGLFSDEERTLVKRVRQAFRDLAPIPCTDCKYCLPCPANVNIPRIFTAYNNVMMHGKRNPANWSYISSFEGERADQCVACGKCEPVCPQQIRIIDWLKKVHAFFSETR